MIDARFVAVVTDVSVTMEMEEGWRCDYEKRLGDENAALNVDRPE